MKFRIPTAGLYNLNNDLDCSGLTDITLCAPMSCPILVINTGATDIAHANIPVSTVVSKYTNLTLAEFYSYNQFISYDFVVKSHAVCIGFVAPQCLLACIWHAKIFFLVRQFRYTNQVFKSCTVTICYS